MQVYPTGKRAVTGTSVVGLVLLILYICSPCGLASRRLRDGGISLANVPITAFCKFAL